jgi:hypothetical protein
MAYYLLFKILSGYSSVEAQIREIEFYNYKEEKIPISELSIIDYSSQYPNSSWYAENIIDGVNSGSNGWCTVDNQVEGAYIIIKSNQRFSKVKIYNDCQGTFAVKECEIYYKESGINPTKDDIDWKLTNQHATSLGNEYPSGLSTQEEIIFSYKYLLQNKSGNLLSFNDWQYKYNGDVLPQNDGWIEILGDSGSSLEINGGCFHFTSKSYDDSLSNTWEKKNMLNSNDVSVFEMRFKIIKSDSGVPLFLTVYDGSKSIHAFIYNNKIEDYNGNIYNVNMIGDYHTIRLEKNKQSDYKFYLDKELIMQGMNFRDTNVNSIKFGSSCGKVELYLDYFYYCINGIPKLINLGEQTLTEEIYKNNGFDDVTAINNIFNQTKVFGQIGLIDNGKIFEIEIPTNAENIEDIVIE